MKTFKQYLLEEDQDIFELIKKECQPFLKVWDNTFLIRGTKTMKEAHWYTDPNDPKIIIPYDKNHVRKDRKPSGTSVNVQQYQDQWFKEKFGEKARSQSLFCYAEHRSSRSTMYGKLYTIFPINKFKIIWSPKVTDLFGQSYEPGYSYTEEDAKRLNLELLDKSEYTDTNPTEALKSRAELMVVCDEYYAMPYNSEDITKYIKDKLS